MAKLKMPVKTATLDFTEDGYPGFRCEYRTNVPVGVLRRETKTEEESRQRELEIFPSWNFVDDEGEPIPHTVEGFDAIPTELFLAMLNRRMEALKAAAMPSDLGDAS